MKQKVAILYGGPSNEHEVSISSAQNILEAIDREKFDVIEIFISKKGICNFENQELKIEEVIPKLKGVCDIVFPVLHGTFGEDGSLQELLEEQEIPFVGSGSRASRIAINKDDSNALFLQNQIAVPKSQVVSKENPTIKINFPIILKPISEGSSVGLFKCNTLKEYEDTLNSIFEKYDEMLAQEFVSGREFTCGVIEIDGKEVALPVSEIILKATKVFDYEAKYTAGACSEITPAEIDDILKNQIQDTALKCHKILGCKSISRTDIIVTSKGELYVLETNTLPGMTKTSFIPAQAQVYGLPMKDLISLLLTL